MIMKYHICVKKNDRNLLHIVSEKELKKPFNGELESLAISHSKTDAIDAATRLIEDFCDVHYGKGKSPDFGAFDKWVRGVFA